MFLPFASWDTKDLGSGRRNSRSGLRRRGVCEFDDAAHARVDPPLPQHADFAYDTLWDERHRRRAVVGLVSGLILTMTVRRQRGEKSRFLHAVHVNGRWRLRGWKVRAGPEQYEWHEQ